MKSLPLCSGKTHIFPTQKHGITEYHEGEEFTEFISQTPGSALTTPTIPPCASLGVLSKCFWSSDCLEAVPIPWGAWQCPPPCRGGNLPLSSSLTLPCKTLPWHSSSLSLALVKGSRDQSCPSGGSRILSSKFVL